MCVNVSLYARHGEAKQKQKSEVQPWGEEFSERARGKKTSERVKYKRV